LDTSIVIRLSILKVESETLFVLRTTSNETLDQTLKFR